VKKVLIITYYWPPSGGGGVQRWLKFAKYLPLFGWKPIVATPKDAEYPSIDKSLISDVGDDIEVVKIPIWEPYKLFKLLSFKKKTNKVNCGFTFEKNLSLSEKISYWLRGNILIPDPRIFWVIPAYKELSRYIKKSEPDWIITTGPPHSIHLIGLKLQRKHNLKWVADFRDPWSNIDYLDKFYPTTFARSIQKRLEKKVLTRANLVISVSWSWAEELKKTSKRNIQVITNGFDTADFKSYKPEDPSKFRITYTGLMSELRNPKFLWEILEEICHENTKFSELLEVNLMGNIDPKLIDGLNNRPLLKGKIINQGYVSHDDVICEYGRSSLLLLLTNDSLNSKGHIPGKIFEYLASKKPILAIGDKNGDIAKILNDAEYSSIHGRNDKANIKKMIIKTFESKAHQVSQSQPNQFSRISLTEKLSHLLNEN